MGEWQFYHLSRCKVRKTRIFRWHGDAVLNLGVLIALQFSSVLNYFIEDSRMLVKSSSMHNEHAEFLEKYSSFQWIAVMKVPNRVLTP